MEKKVEFARLFQEFVSSYPYTPKGLRHRAAYEERRQQKRRNFEAISATIESAEELTKPILYQLFPDREFTFNPSSDDSATLIVPGTFESYLNMSLWEKDIVHQIGENLFNFISYCYKNPDQLSVACHKFSKQQYFQTFPTEMLTIFLNALHPDKFLLINERTLKIINYFANTFYSSLVNTFYNQQLIDYPVIVATGHYLIKDFAKEMHQSGVPALRDDDLFDMFCYWLLDVKRYDFISKESTRVDEIVEITIDVEQVEQQQEYTLSQLADDIGFEEAKLNRWIRAIERKKHLIFSGSPGTGKTYIAEQLANHLISNSDGFSELVQFHPAYSYEDFIQGIRPQSQDGILTYPLIPGRFLEFCEKAEFREGLCVLIIDEINRANLAQVFGELMYLLEYRNKKIHLAGSNELFSIPTNVRIIGTMNTADRSIALVDHALRRRFAFIELRPNYNVLRRYHDKKKTGFQVEGLIKTLERLNNAIANKHYEIGMSFFLTENLTEDIEDIWQMEIEPYLEEYFFDQLDKVDEFRWDEIKKQVCP